MKLRVLFLAPFLLLLILFAASNTARVTLGLWPTGYTMDLPLTAAILLGAVLAFLLGAVFVWFGSLTHRRRARRAEKKVITLEAEVATLRQQLNRPPVPVMPPPQ